jgi:hypothetical protein
MSTSRQLVLSSLSVIVTVLPIASSVYLSSLDAIEHFTNYLYQYYQYWS